ncbi:hypothetical protein TPA0909_53540 [Streptomyces albus]|nr:hypothetical protein TPA0909_53540 [Streptomyces albus]
MAGAGVGAAEEFGRLGQSAAPVERPGVAVQLLPAVGGLGESAVGAQPFAVLVDPAAEPGPGGDEGFVGEIDGVPVQGEQPGGDETFEYVAAARAARRVAAVALQLGAGRRAPGVPGPLRRGR